MAGEKNLDTLFSEKGLPAALEPLTLTTFISKVITPLEIDPQVGELVFWQLHQKKEISIKAFKDYIQRSFIPAGLQIKVVPHNIIPAVSTIVSPPKEKPIAEDIQKDILPSKPLVTPGLIEEEKKELIIPAKPTSPEVKSPCSVMASLPYPGDDKFNAAEFVAKLEEITKIPLKVVLDIILFNDEGNTD